VLKKSQPNISRARAARLTKQHKNLSPLVTHSQVDGESPQENSKEYKDSTKTKESIVRPQLRAWGLWKTAWAFIGPIVGLITFYTNFTPAISIAPGVNIDKTQTFSTQLLVTNTGRVPVYNLTFSCGFGSSNLMVIKHLETHIQDIAPIPKLIAGQSVSKACAYRSEMFGNLRLNFTVTFEWPIIGATDTKTASFIVKEGPDGYFLLPSGMP
jgi:hypothetical protein